MEAINLSAFNLNTGKEFLSFPLDYVEDDLATKHRRKHKKKRINKKWAKRYGFKCVTKTTKGWKLKTYRDGSFEFIK